MENVQFGTADCTAHFIRTDLLTGEVTENLRKVTSYAARHEARFMKLLTERTEDGSKRRNAAKKKELEAAKKRIAELSAIFRRLYEDSVTGCICRQDRTARLKPDPSVSQPDRERQNFLHFFYFFISHEQSLFVHKSPPLLIFYRLPAVTFRHALSYESGVARLMVNGFHRTLSCIHGDNNFVIHPHPSLFLHSSSASIHNPGSSRQYHLQKQPVLNKAVNIRPHLPLRFQLPGNSP